MFPCPRPQCPERPREPGPLGLRGDPPRDAFPTARNLGRPGARSTPRAARIVNARAPRDRRRPTGAPGFGGQSAAPRAVAAGERRAESVTRPLRRCLIPHRRPAACAAMSEEKPKVRAGGRGPALEVDSRPRRPLPRPALRAPSAAERRLGGRQTAEPAGPPRARASRPSPRRRAARLPSPARRAVPRPPPRPRPHGRASPRPPPRLRPQARPRPACPPGSAPRLAPRGPRPPAAARPPRPRPRSGPAPPGAPPGAGPGRGAGPALRSAGTAAPRVSPLPVPKYPATTAPQPPQHRVSGTPGRVRTPLPWRPLSGSPLPTFPDGKLPSRIPIAEISDATTHFGEKPRPLPPGPPRPQPLLRTSVASALPCYAPRAGTPVRGPAQRCLLRAPPWSSLRATARDPERPGLAARAGNLYRTPACRPRACAHPPLVCPPACPIPRSA